MLFDAESTWKNEESIEGNTGHKTGSQSAQNRAGLMTGGRVRAKLAVRLLSARRRRRVAAVAAGLA